MRFYKTISECIKNGERLIPYDDHKLISYKFLYEGDQSLLKLNKFKELNRKLDNGDIQRLYEIGETIFNIEDDGKNFLIYKIVNIDHDNQKHMSSIIRDEKINQII